MCGIVGILNNHLPVERSELQRMNERLIHRGPDEDGAFVQGRTGLAMRRLRVIDLEGGSQPVSNEDGSCRIVFNGEIYNYPDIQKSLRQRGHTLATNSDTETIVHLYEDYGADCVDHLNGMFAFAIHDARDDSVLLARDRIGIKPLYYAETAKGLLFGSEIKALLSHPDLSRELDPHALDAYLTFKFIPAPLTIYKAIRKLPAGHLMKWKDGRSKIEPYWTLSFDHKDQRSDQELASEFETRFSDAVRSQMISDVPLGAFLSGGLDSSLIVSEMAAQSDRPIETFSIGFEEASYSELDHARTVAHHFGTHHHELVVRPDVSSLFETVANQFDEPFGDSSAIPTYLVSELARQHVTVALSGTGADELFAGYERYWAVPLSAQCAKLPRIARRGLTALFNRLPSGHAKRSFVSRAARFLETQTMDTFERHTSLISLFDVDARRRLYTEAFAAEIGEQSPLDLVRPQFDDSESVNELDRLLGFDTRTILPDDYLTKDDRMGMANSLELRVPFLDHTLVEFAASCPTRTKLKGLKTKTLLRRVASGRIPKSILGRPKHGFEVPMARWISKELSDHVDGLLLSDQSRLGEYLRPAHIGALVGEHRSGSKNHSREIWSLMSLEMWLQTEPRTSNTSEKQNHG